MLLHKWAVWLPSVWILAPMGLMIIDAFSLMNEHITAISIRPDRKSHHCKATIPPKYYFQPDFVYSLNTEWTWSCVEVIQMILSPATSSQWMIIKVLFFLVKSNVTLLFLWKCKCSLLGWMVWERFSLLQKEICDYPPLFSRPGLLILSNQPMHFLFFSQNLRTKNC